MWSPRRLIRSPVNWTRALIVGGVVSLTYTSIVVAYSLFPFSNVDISEPVWQTAGSLTLLSLGVIGAPIALWLRYRLRSPLAFLGGILLFWHVLVEFPPIGSGQGDSPGFLFVFALSPLYVAAYGILAGTEYWVRQNRFPTLS